MRVLLKPLSMPLPAALRGLPTHPARRHTLTFGVLALVLALAVSACGPTSASHTTAKPTPTHPLGTPLPTIPPTPAVVDTSGSHTTLPAATGWNLVGSPGVGTEGRLTAVAALSASDAWAVGQFEGTDGRQHTLTEHWDGSSWTVVASPSPGPRANILSAVAARTTSDAWAVGSLIGTDSITRRSSSIGTARPGRPAPLPIPVPRLSTPSSLASAPSPRATPGRWAQSHIGQTTRLLISRP